MPSYTYKPRSKEIGPSQTTANRKSYKQLPGQSPIITADTTGTVSYEHRKTSGVDIVGFSQLKKSGVLLPLTWFDQLEITGRVTAASLDMVKPSTGERRWVTPDPHSLLWTFWVTEVELDTWASQQSQDTAEYVQAAAAKIYGSGWDVLTFVAELKTVVRMFKRLLHRLITTLARGRFDRLWLEGRYGWRLLLYDIKDIIEAVNSIDDKRKRFKESVGQTLSTQNVVTKQTESWETGVYIHTAVDVLTVGLRGTVVADIEPPKFGLNPIMTAWELITLSFVVDWVLGVGKWLAAMHFLVFSTQHYAAGGVHLQWDRTTSISSKTWKNGWTGTYIVNTASVASKTVRLPTTVSKIPLPTIRLDDWKVLDLLAILRGVRRLS